MVLPNRSSIRKIKKHFKVSNYAIWAAKKSVAVDGIVSDQNAKPGTVSPPIKAKMAEQFVSQQDHNRNIQGVFKKRPNICYKDFIAHVTAF